MSHALQDEFNQEFVREIIREKTIMDEWGAIQRAIKKLDSLLKKEPTIAVVDSNPNVLTF